MEADRHVQLFERVPQRLDRLVVQMLAVDRVRRADDRDRAELPDASARLFDRRRTPCIAICAANFSRAGSVLQ